MEQKILNAFNAALSAAIGGAAMAILSVFTDPANITMKKILPVAGGGAVLGLAQHYRTPPTVRAQQAMLLRETPAGQVAQAENAVVGAAAATVEAQANKVTEAAENPPKGV